VVIDPIALKKEIEDLAAAGIIGEALRQQPRPSDPGISPTD
jgi:hypothetical protein